MRRSGIPLTIASFHFIAWSPSPRTVAIIGVLVGPGQMALSSTFLRANSRASDLVKEIRPPLRAEFGFHLGHGFRDRRGISDVHRIGLDDRLRRELCGFLTGFRVDVEDRHL